MSRSQPQLVTPQAVISYCCEDILAKRTWPGGGNGAFTVFSNVPRRSGEISGLIEGWESISFRFKCEDVKNCDSPVLLNPDYPPDVCKVFRFVEGELLRTWQSAAREPDKVLVSGRLVVRSEFEQDRQRFRLLIGEHPRQRLFVQAYF